MASDSQTNTPRPQAVSSVISPEQVQKLFDAFYEEEGKETSQVREFIERKKLGFG